MNILKQLRLWPFADLDIWEVPSRQIWYDSVMELAMSDPVKRVNFEASIWRAYDNWQSTHPA